MRTVQLDKNAGGKKLRDACNRQGVVRCILLPRSVREGTDEDVANFGSVNGYLTLTFDRTFCFCAAQMLAGRNPGLLLLRADDGDIKQMSTKTAPGELRRFKQDFPEWHEASWTNSVVELTPKLAYVYHTLGAMPVRVDWLERGKPGWQAKLKQLLQQNADAFTTTEPDE